MFNLKKISQLTLIFICKISIFNSSCRYRSLKNQQYLIGIVVEWLKRRAYDEQDLGLKPAHAILLCP